MAPITLERSQDVLLTQVWGKFVLQLSLRSQTDVLQLDASIGPCSVQQDPIKVGSFVSVIGFGKTANEGTCACWHAAQLATHQVRAGQILPECFGAATDALLEFATATRHCVETCDSPVKCIDC